MFSFILASLVCIFVLWYEARYLVRQRMWRDFGVVLALVALGYILAVGPLLGVSIPKIPRLIGQVTSVMVRLVGLNLTDSQ